MSYTSALKSSFDESDDKNLQVLRELRKKIRAENVRPGPLTLGQKVADAVATGMGSWLFIIIQSAILVCWITLNIVGYIHHWDPYPFILLNLALSFQAAYTAPVIMMSQNRQQEIDRQTAQNDYRINVKAELEIELLHQKIDQLRELEIVNLTQTVKELSETIRKLKTER